MGTNFYLATKSKETRDKYFGWKYEIVDEPDWGYEIHIAKNPMIFKRVPLIVIILKR